MNSKERHEACYLRRKQKREEKRKARDGACGTVEEIFSIRNLHDSFRKCKKTVQYKSRVQHYALKAFRREYKTKKLLLSGQPIISQKLKAINIVERGRQRLINPVDIEERVPQRCFCDRLLVPVIRPTLINNNGASLKGKGIDFARRQLVKDIVYMFRRYGGDCAIVTGDFSKYFENILYDPLFERNRTYIYDEAKRKVADYFVGRQFACGEAPKTKGLDLGAQPSQINAVSYANEIDHLMTGLGIRYARFMDDTYFMHPDKEYLIKVIEIFTAICGKYGIKINLKKTKFSTLKKGFVFLKIHYHTTESGRIVRKPDKRTFVAERRKIRKFRELVDNGLMTFKQALDAFRSWNGNLRKYTDSHTSRIKMWERFKNLFDKELQEECCIIKL